MASVEGGISLVLGRIRASADFFEQCLAEIQEQCLDELNSVDHAAQRLQTALEAAALSSAGGSAVAESISSANKLRKEVAATRIPMPHSGGVPRRGSAGMSVA